MSSSRYTWYCGASCSCAALLGSYLVLLHGMTNILTATKTITACKHDAGLCEHAATGAWEQSPALQGCSGTGAARTVDAPPGPAGRRPG